MALLKVSDLSLDVPGHRLLDNIGFAAEAHERLVVVGPSGSGKSLLLNCLCGIITPTSGSVSVGGVELTSLSLSERSEYRLRHIGMVFQSGELLPELTVLENVALPLKLIGVSRDEAERRAAAWLNRLELGQRGEMLPDMLCDAEVLRTGLARALAHEPLLVLADEPTAALDEENTLAIGALLAGAAKDLGTTVVVATDDPLVASKADRVLWLRDGRLKPAGELDRSTQVESP